MTIAEQFIERGIEKGMEKGRREGIQVGLAKGHLEEKYRVAKKLLAAGVELDLIARTTGLSQAELQTLREKEEA